MGSWYAFVWVDDPPNDRAIYGMGVQIVSVWGDDWFLGWKNAMANMIALQDRASSTSYVGGRSCVEDVYPNQPYLALCQK